MFSLHAALKHRSRLQQWLILRIRALNDRFHAEDISVGLSYVAMQKMLNIEMTSFDELMAEIKATPLEAMQSHPRQREMAALLNDIIACQQHGYAGLANSFVKNDVNEDCQASLVAEYGYVDSAENLAEHLSGFIAAVNAKAYPPFPIVFILQHAGRALALEFNNENGWVILAANLLPTIRLSDSAKAADVIKNANPNFRSFQCSIYVRKMHHADMQHILTDSAWVEEYFHKVLIKLCDLVSAKEHDEIIKIFQLMPTFHTRFLLATRQMPETNQALIDAIQSHSAVFFNQVKQSILGDDAVVGYDYKPNSYGSIGGN